MNSTSDEKEPTMTRTLSRWAGLRGRAVGARPTRPRTARGHPRHSDHRRAHRRAGDPCDRASRCSRPAPRGKNVRSARPGHRPPAAKSPTCSTAAPLPGAFAITYYPGETALRDAIRNRDVYGGISFGTGADVARQRLQAGPSTYRSGDQPDGRADSGDAGRQRHCPAGRGAAAH